MTTSPAFDVITKTDTATMTIEVIGELDVLTAPAFEQAMRSALTRAPLAIVVDLRPLTFIGSTGVALLLRYAQQSRAQDQRFSVVPGGRHVRRVFAIVGIQDHLDVIETSGHQGDISQV